MNKDNKHQKGIISNYSMRQIKQRPIHLNIRNKNKHDANSQLDQLTNDMINNFQQINSCSIQTRRSCRNFITSDGLKKCGFKDVRELLNKYNITDQKLPYKLFHSALVEDSLKLKTGDVPWTVLVCLTKKIEPYWHEIWVTAKELHLNELTLKGLSTSGKIYPTAKIIKRVRANIVPNVKKTTTKLPTWIVKKALDQIIKEFPRKKKFIYQVLSSDKKMIKMLISIYKNMPTDTKKYSKVLNNYFL